MNSSEVVWSHRVLGGTGWRYRLKVNSSREKAMEENPERPPLAAMVEMDEDELGVWHVIRERQIGGEVVVGRAVQARED